MGYNTNANAVYSTAIGYNNIGNGNPSLLVITDPLFEVGNGISTDSRSNAMTILKNGNTGINIATPSSVLEVAHLDGIPTPSDLTNAFSIRNLGTGTSDQESWQMYVVNDGYLGLYEDGNFKGVFNENTGAYQNVSDARLKSDVKDLSLGQLDKVLRLRPVSYLMKDQANDERHIGLIAQEVQQVVSQVVDVGNDKDQTLTVSYSELVPVLIKAIQEQQAIIEDQKADMEDLKAWKEKVDRLLAIDH